MIRLLRRRDDGWGCSYNFNWPWDTLNRWGLLDICRRRPRRGAELHDGRGERLNSNQANVRAVAIILVVALTIAPIPASNVGAQTNDYRIIPGQRLGKYELDKPLAAYNLGQPSWQGTGTTQRGLAFWDFFFFVGQALRIDTCRSDGRAYAIFAYRRFDRPETEPEATKYKTAEGVGVGIEESETVRLLGRPPATSEWTERQGTIEIPVVEYQYPGLLIRFNRSDHRAFAIGVQTRGGRSACEGDVLVLTAVKDSAQQPAPAISRPVALTPCEVSELRRRLLADADARALYARYSFRLADAALDEPPSPLPRIQLVGLLPTDPRAQLSERSLRDAQKVEALGYAYAATGDVRFAERAGVYLEAWAKTNQPDGNPINETKLASMVRGFSLVAESLAPPTRQAVEAWLTRVASLEIESRSRFGGSTAINNWHSHRLKIVGTIGYALGDAALIRYAEEGFRAQIGVNLRSDGSSFDFHERDALYYHIYNLEPLLELAIAASKRGVNLYAYQAPSGASLERSVAFVLPYSRGEKTHEEFANSRVEFDRRRAAAGIPGFSGPFNPLRAARLYELAAYFNPVYGMEPLAGEVRRTFQTVLNQLWRACSK